MKVIVKMPRISRKFRMLGHVDTAVIDRPYACVAMHPHEELVIMEVLLQHPEKTLSEILHEVYEEMGSALNAKCMNATNSQCQRIASLV